MVDDLYERLGLSEVIGPLKAKGIPLDALTRGILAYRLTERFSILQASEWLNRPEILEQFELKGFDEKTLYRAVETIGQNRDMIVRKLQDGVLELLGRPRTDVLLDWTSVVRYGDLCRLDMFGYSRDHHPEERQVTLGVALLAPPYNVPIGLTVEAGNVNDQTHMRSTYGQVRQILMPGSLVVFDRGANDKANLERIELDGNDYLTAKKLNKSDDQYFSAFSVNTWECLDAKDGLYVLKKRFPSRTNYYFFSKKLLKNNVKSVCKKAERLLADAKRIQKSLDKGKGLPKPYRINNPLVDVKYDYQTRLTELDEEEALRLLFEDGITGREGCFCITSNRDMPASEALRIYREKDAIEKMFHSLKGELKVRPVRTFTEDTVRGVLLLGFIAQVMVSLTRYFVKPVKRMSTEFILASLKKLTLTVILIGNGMKRKVYSNFDPVNKAILAEYLAEV